MLDMMYIQKAHDIVIIKKPASRKGGGYLFMSDLIKKHACSTMTRKFIFMVALRDVWCKYHRLFAIFNKTSMYIKPMYTRWRASWQTRERKLLHSRPQMASCVLLTHKTKLKLIALKINWTNIAVNLNGFKMSQYQLKWFIRERNYSKITKTTKKTITFNFDLYFPSE